jgi:mannose-1-phosphate guanylyltransferase/phosphomannomutase
MINQAVIIAGGKGKRLKKITGNNPKILVPLKNETLLEFQINYLKKNKIEKIHFCLGEGSSEILKKLENLKIEFTYSTEDQPLGTYGALQNAKKYLMSEFFVLFGDILLEYDIQFGYSNFKKFQSDIHLISRYTEHPIDSDIVQIDDEFNVLSLKRHDQLDFPYEPIGNTGLFFCKKNIVNKNKEKKDFFKEFLVENIHSLKVTSEITTSYIRDIGTVERFESEVKRFDKIRDSEEKYVFLDRDGTLINDRGNDNNISKFKFKTGAINLIKFLQSENYKLILISNQPGVAKGFFNIEKVKKFNSHLQHILINNNLKPLDGIYFCPHHPEKGFVNEVKELKINCLCRKPNIGLVKKATEELNIKNQRFYFIGDTESDYLLAKKFKSKIFIVKSKNTEKSLLNNQEIKIYNNLNEIVNEFKKNFYNF